MTVVETEPRTTVDGRPRGRRLLGPGITIGALAGLTVAVHFHDPHQVGSWGGCPLYDMTGIYCPGCGGLRAVNDLTRGDVGAAASSNLFFVVLVPAVVALLALWLADRWRGITRPLPEKAVGPVLWTGLTVWLVFTVVRNFAFGSWLAP